MGPQSQQCTGSVKKSKEAAISHKKKHGGKKGQLTIPFLPKKKDAAGSSSTKTKTIKSNNIVTPATVKKRKYTSGCYQCWRLTYNPNSKKAHDITCPRSLHYGKSKETVRVETVAAANIEKNNRPLEHSEKATGSVSKEDLDAFLDPGKKGRSDENSEEAEIVVLDDSDDDPMDDDPTDDDPTDDDSRIMTAESLSADRIAYEVNARMKDPTRRMTKKKVVLLQVAALVEYILTMLPNRGKKDAQDYDASLKPNSLASRQLEAYRKYFPPGTLGFTVPPWDKSKSPDQNYTILEGRTIYFVRWEMNIPNFKLRCPCSNCSGKMTHERYDFCRYSHLTPVQDITGITSYAVSMRYKCSECKKVFKGNDGELYNQIPFHFRQGYPVDPRFTKKHIHLTTTTTRILEPLMVTHGNGDQIARLFHELQAKKYEDMEEQYFDHALNTSTKLTSALPSLRVMNGSNTKYGLTGAAVRDLYLEGATSTATATGMSNNMRNTLEIQAVGSNKSSASDHTFKIVKNYQSKDIDGAAAVHTINNESGMICCAAVVQSTDASQFSHQFESFTKRSNVNPKMHVVDNYPANKILYDTLFRENCRTVNPVILRLGLFHFIQRVTKTFDERHFMCRLATRELSDCIWYEEKEDVQQVELGLLDGSLNRGVPMSFKEIKEYRYSPRWRARFGENIRVWTRPEQIIGERMDEWFSKFEEADEDPKTKQDLFTWETKKAFDNVRKYIFAITDVLDRKDLYEPVEPGSRSKSKLKTWVGARGTESKLEKFHHCLAHFANRGMRRELVDAVSLAGMALFNLRIRYRQKLNSSPKLKDSIPSEFQKSPSHLNHSRLHLINKKGRIAGLKFDVHLDLVKLPQDNGERFLGEYWLEQKERNARLEAEELKTSKIQRCMCETCGGRRGPAAALNPYFSQFENSSVRLFKYMIKCDRIISRHKPFFAKDHALAVVARLLGEQPSAIIGVLTLEYIIMFHGIKSSTYVLLRL
jgi:hypothetical protein